MMPQNWASKSNASAPLQTIPQGTPATADSASHRAVGAVYAPARRPCPAHAPYSRRACGSRHPRKNTLCPGRRRGVCLSGDRPHELDPCVDSDRAYAEPAAGHRFCRGTGKYLGSENVLFELVHLGKEDGTPKLTHPKRPGWSWNTLVAKGDPAEWILAAGADFDVDLIVMTTEGHTSLFDLLRGSTTERVVRGARCPLLAIPA